MKTHRTEATWKRSLKFGISLAVYGLSATATLLGRLLGKRRQASCVVLYYHSIPPDERNLFANQLDVIRRHATPLRLDGTVAPQPGVRYVGITFDDAIENFVDCALPELAKRQMPAAVFVISDAIGRSFGLPGQREKVMSLEQIRALPRELVTIGSHTLTHPMLPLINEQRARLEIRESRARLEELLGREIMLFSFPFGGFNDELIDLCREAGYRRVFTTLPLLASMDPKTFVVGRVWAEPTDWPLEFRLKIAGAYRWLPFAFALKQRLMVGRLGVQFPAVTRSRIT